MLSLGAKQGPENVINWIVWCSAISCPTRRFLGIFWSQWLPSAWGGTSRAGADLPLSRLPKGAKGSPKKSDYKIQSDSLPVYQGPILNHDDSSRATPTFYIMRPFYSAAQARDVLLLSAPPKIPQNQQEPHFSAAKAHWKCQIMPLQRFILNLYYQSDGALFVRFFLMLLEVYIYTHTYIFISHIYIFIFFPKEMKYQSFLFWRAGGIFKTFSHQRRWKRSLSPGLLLVSQSMTGSRKVQVPCSGISKNSWRITNFESDLTEMISSPQCSARAVTAAEHFDFFCSQILPPGARLCHFQILQWSSLWFWSAAPFKSDPPARELFWSVFSNLNFQIYKSVFLTQKLPLV